MAFAIALHVLSVVIWVGGMFFAFMALRPAAYSLEVSLRLKLWAETLRRFFPWVWGAIITLLLTGYWLIFALFGGMKGLALHINLMQGIGIFMMLLFMHVFFSPYRRFKKAVSENNTELGMKYLKQIRILVLVNLLLGITTIIVATAGRYGLFT
ncbi:MAG: hypothetical protein A3I05_03120 [Deltaproteobacteria bacterium RIFCSPLOWO2_02_FULL_44_10]|nr:MAG: hypothetical protein A3C46_09000 [Deltaproteobacteria bacterium RIFCSPHIGHO2_02_FULL_44_16]OGQ46882.1 MAG: hypothetical protein A3I05_03120 [Deltaproteobacteria bacterium RIFCSPLOWO2_02_FULL_44_10]